MGAPAHPIVHLDARKEVVEAYATHAKLRCFFNPPKPVPLKRGVQLTAKYVNRTQSKGGFVPSGYRHIEVHTNMPPSWKTFLGLPP